MPTITKVFISATSRDLGTLRKAVSEVLLRGEVHPVVQDYFGADHRSVSGMLRDRISECDAVICLVGRVYGQEPQSREPDQPRRSYTQLEYDIAVELGKPIFTFFAADDCPMDNPTDEPDELRVLQLEHVRRLKELDRIFETFSSRDELKEKVGFLRFDPQSLQSITTGLVVVLLAELMEAAAQRNRMGEEAWVRDVVHPYHALLDSTLSRWKARFEPKTPTVCLLTFESVDNAVQAALALHQEVGRYGWASAAPRVRVGIHFGQIIRLTGVDQSNALRASQTVELCERLTSLATAGQTLLTRVAFDNARESFRQMPVKNDEPTFELQWESHGRYVFADSNESLEVCEVGVKGVSPLTPPLDSPIAKQAGSHEELQMRGWRPSIGQAIPNASEWIIESKLGEGGFGEVWLARHQRMKEQRVFKFCFEPERLRSFKRELSFFRLIQKHLGDRDDIARLLDVQVDKPPYYLESEYVASGDLRKWADRQGNLDQVPLETRLQLLIGVARAVAAAHSLGIIHKDLKPSNIFIVERDGVPHPRLADFGIGVLMDKSLWDQHQITATGFTESLMAANNSSRTGTRLYASPESLVGKQATTAGDVYALGVMLYQLVVGDFDRPLGTGWADDVSDELLREDITACTHRDPTRRLPSAADLADRLEQLGQRRKDQLALQQSADNARRVRTIRFAAALILIVVVLVSATFVQMSRREANVALAGQLVAQADRSLAQKEFATAEIASAKALTIKDSPETRLQLLRARAGGVRLVAGSHATQSEARLSAFSRDGDLGAVLVHRPAKPGCLVSVFRTAEGAEVASFELDYVPESLALDQSNQETRYLACGSPAPDFNVEIWKIDLTKKQAQLHGKLDRPHTKRIPSMAFHPTQPWLAVGGEDRTLRLWDFSSNRPRLLWERLKAHGTNIHGIAFNHDGSLLGSGGGDYLAKVWSIPTDDPTTLAPDAKPKFTLAGHVDSVFCVAFSPDGSRLASAGYDRVVRVWSLPSKSDEASSPPRSVNTLEGHEGTVLDLAFSQDSLLLVSGGKDGTVRLWHVNQGRILTTLRPECGDIRSVAYVNFGDDVYCGGESGWGIWSVRERTEAGRIWNGGATVNVLAFDPLGEYLAAGGTDGKVRLWDNEHRLERVLESGVEDESFNGIAFDAQGHWLAAGGDSGTVHVWDRKTNWRKLDLNMTHGGPVWGLCFDPQGHWLATSNSSAEICIKKWDTAKWTLLDTFGESMHSIYALGCYVEDGRTYLVSGDAEAKVIVRDAQTGTVTAEKTNVTSGERNVWSVAIGRDPLSVDTGNSDGRVRRWTPDSNKEPLATSEDDSNVNPTVNSVSQSEKHRWIAAGGDGRSVEIYDFDLKKVLSLVGQDGNVWWVTFDREGSRLAFGGTDGIVRFWNVDEMQRTRLTATPGQLYEESQKATGLSVENGKFILRRGK